MRSCSFERVVNPQARSLRATVAWGLSFEAESARPAAVQTLAAPPGGSLNDSNTAA
eukprot:SAG22_NODE_19133_length_277_cov_2.280899_1_plen_55_part_01